MIALRRCCILFWAVLLCGCLSQVMPDKSEQKDESDKNGEQQAEADAGNGHRENGNADFPPDRRVAGKRGTVGMVTKRVENYKELIKQKPHLKIIKRPRGGTLISDAYYSAVGRVSVMKFERNMQIYKEANGGRWPTYKEYTTQMKQFQVNLAKLPPWQYYAYNEDTGKLLVLEDTPMKQKAYDK